MSSASEIRPFTERDRNELRQLFGRAGQGAPSAALWGHEPSVADIFLIPYMDFLPESLFVAVEDGSPVGYLTGCPDDASFPSEHERMTAAVKRHHLFLRPKPVAFMLRAKADVTAARLRRQSIAGEFTDPRWPAHLHINVVPEVRGRGVAAALMGRWLDELSRSGSRGCHLETLVENARAVRFFERSGFVRHGDNPAVPGIRDHGRRLHQQTMVWSA